MKQQQHKTGVFPMYFLFDLIARLAIIPTALAIDYAINDTTGLCGIFLYAIGAI